MARFADRSTDRLTELCRGKLLISTEAVLESIRDLTIDPAQAPTFL